MTFRNSIFYPIQYYKRFCRNYSMYFSSRFKYYFDVVIHNILCNKSEIKNYTIYWDFMSYLVLTYVFFRIMPLTLDAWMDLFFRKTFVNTLTFTMYFYALYNIYCVLFILRIQLFFRFTGGDVWVLSIKNVKFNDSGLYACEVNSDPVVRSFHSLSGKLKDNYTSSFKYISDIKWLSTTRV